MDPEKAGMLGGGISYSTADEKDMESKSVKYAYELKDKAIRFMTYQAFCLSLLLFFSLLTLRDSFTCTGSYSECDDIRGRLSCKASLVSPISLQFYMNASQSHGAYVSVTCGWETASSQIRICIVLCAIYATYLAYQAAKNENRKSTDSYLQACGFLSFLLGATAMFDLLAIVDS